MKKLSLILIAIFSFVLTAFSKDDNKVVTWNVTLKALGNNTYQVNAEAILKEGFHIWAMDAGGDGSLINTEITFDDAAIEWVDKTWESSRKPITVTYDFIDGAVHYFEKKVVLSRKFISKEVPKIKGTITFQTCNESMCFPPEDVSFEVK
ncbi:MAG TPA: protein-disulfide reductase DsbD family protein [Edaphocola sp.]|nr:protein-disulfide reductase DsbD family protein [Edaphocola sp.]